MMVSSGQIPRASMTEADAMKRPLFEFMDYFFLKFIESAIWNQ
ncbi:hypothetical protein C7450_10547 [Chelatococcus asaccharovorans]|uniref:Uncharacterized protein n=1 Tax=Chelatococcus asaccharovorans TaxID=28210 RepID=A0A2V3U664_9HYPH|nr:hypothetical protein C7450_10547 [Chelatococcus asaccharovorans]